MNRDDFSKQKIVWGNLCLNAQFAIVEEGAFINAPSPLITPAEPYLLAILNSSVGDWYIRQLSVTRSGGYFEYKSMFFEQLPLPSLSKEETSNLNYLVDKLPKDDESQLTNNIKSEIDSAVASIYGLSSDEICIISSTDSP